MPRFRMLRSSLFAARVCAALLVMVNIDLDTSIDTLQLLEGFLT